MDAVISAEKESKQRGRWLDTGGNDGSCLQCRRVVVPCSTGGGTGLGEKFSDPRSDWMTSQRLPSDLQPWLCGLDGPGTGEGVWSWGNIRAAKSPRGHHRGATSPPTLLKPPTARPQAGP